jgi:hypothetical protein
MAGNPSNLLCRRRRYILALFGRYSIRRAWATVYSHLEKKETKTPFTCDCWSDSEKRTSLKSGEIARTAPPDAHDAQLSNGSIGASIRVPFNNGTIRLGVTSRSIQKNNGGKW